mgnify:FL=1
MWTENLDGYQFDLHGPRKSRDSIYLLLWRDFNGGRALDEVTASLGEDDREVLEKLRSKGEAWIVGGWVREFLSGSDPKELDIATNLEPGLVKSIFPKSIMIGEKYGTVRVRLDDEYRSGKIWEVTTLRVDGGYGDGRRPDNVEFGDSIHVDLSRRDFTINSMAIGSNCEIIDPHGGKSDLESGIIRCVGDPAERLGEDGLRIIRAFRFLEKGELGLRDLDLELSRAISVNLHMLERISKERIWSELKMILSKPNSGKIVRLMHEHGVIEELLPGVSLNLDADLCLDYSVNLAILCSLDNRNGEELSNLLSENLRLSRAESDTVSFLHGLRIHDLDPSMPSVRRFRAALPRYRHSQVFGYLRGIGKETSEFEESLAEVSSLKAGTAPLVDGNTLSEKTGLEPGRRLGRLKAWLHRKQIEEDLAGIEEVIPLIDSLNWKDSDYEEWPILSWP